MPITEQLFPASFKGIRFLMPRETESGGKKVAIHEYPGISKRFVEELGKLEPVFSIIAVIHGLDVPAQRIRLTEALNSPDAGTFTHPYIGPVQVVCTNFSARSSDAALGEIIFDIEFTKTSEAASLVALDNDIRFANVAAQGAREAADAAMLDRYRNIRDSDSAALMGSRLTEQLDVIQREVQAVVTPATDALNEVNRRIIDTKGDILSIVRTPQKLVNARRGLFDSVLALGDAPADLRREWASLTNFGAPIRTLSNGQRSRALGSIRAPIRRTTAKRILEDDNLRVLDQHTRIEALINSFEAEAAFDFGTDIELAEARQRLADDFDRIVQDQADVVATSSLGDEVLTDDNITQPSEAVSEAVAFSSGLAFDPDLRSALEDLRAATFAVLSESRKNTFRVKIFDLGVTDVQLAAYQLYGTLDSLDEFAALNGDQNHGFMREPVKGLVS